MIPCALELEGFLSFREKRRLEFPRQGITMLSGPNGAGKSSVFDGILLALFGGCRLKKEPDVALINVESNQATVALEFEMSGAQYRVQRILTRNNSGGYEQSADLRIRHDDGNWKPLPGTRKLRDLDRKLGEILGMSYEGFTTSVLLLQGKAETLLNADAPTAEIRFKALSAIVGLEFYADLHKRADQKRKDLRDEVGELRGALSQIEQVTPEQIEEIRGQIEQANEKAATAAKATENLELACRRAEAWQRFGAELSVLETGRKQQAALLQDAAAIEKEGRRLEELEKVLPIVQEILKHREAIRSHEQAAGKCKEERDQLLNERREQEAANTELKQQIESIVADQERDAARSREVSDELQGLKLTLPILRRFRSEREKLLQTSKQLGDVEATIKKLEKEEAQALENLAPLEKTLQEAADALCKAEQNEIRTRTQHDEMLSRQQRFASVAGEQRCNYCGQELTPEHVELERGRIDEELSRRKNEYDAALKQRAEYEAARRKAEEACKKGKAALDAVRASLQTCRSSKERELNKQKMEIEAIAAAYNDLPIEWQSRISASPSEDWASTLYPTKGEIEALDQRLKTLEDQARELQETNNRRERERRNLQAKQKEAEAALNAADRRLTPITEKLATLTANTQAARDQAQSLREMLPASWRVQVDVMSRRDFEQLQEEQTQLQSRNVYERLEQLQQARANRQSLEDSIARLESARAAIPEEFRRDPVEFRQLLSEAQKQHRDHHGEAIRLVGDCDRLLCRQKERAEREASFKQAEVRQRVAEELTELLGPKHLQRHLIREAEVAIVANANRVLDHLTAGGLQIELMPDDENERKRALQIQVKKSDGHTYSILSGSERFRVAISLALGIGQFASRQHRRIETVVIDEGFGCLDRENRQTMIDEIAGLIGELKCILLVSHQEDFADAFPRGYRFTKINGATQVEPLHG